MAYPGFQILFSENHIWKTIGKMWGPLKIWSMAESPTPAIYFFASYPVNHCSYPSETLFWGCLLNVKEKISSAGPQLKRLPVYGTYLLSPSPVLQNILSKIFHLIRHLHSSFVTHLIHFHREKYFVRPLFVLTRPIK